MTLPTYVVGYLILKHVSHLDAFSVYHSRTRLPSYALGRTTGAPEVRPFVLYELTPIENRIREDRVKSETQKL